MCRPLQAAHRATSWVLSLGFLSQVLGEVTLRSDLGNVTCPAESLVLRDPQNKLLLLRLVKSAERERERQADVCFAVTQTGAGTEPSGGAKRG